MFRCRPSTATCASRVPGSTARSPEMVRSASTGELRRLFDLVCDLPRAARRERLVEAGADTDTIAEIEALLDAEGATTARVRTPVARLLGELSETELGEG